MDTQRYMEDLAQAADVILPSDCQSIHTLTAEVNEATGKVTITVRYRTTDGTPDERITKIGGSR